MNFATVFEAVIRKIGYPQLFQSPSAPNWHLVALNLDGIGTVSGKGTTREAAYASCFGEASEVLSALARPADTTFRATDIATGVASKVDGASVTIWKPGGKDPVGTEGLGAGETVAAAQTSSFLELIERHHVAQWWISEQPGVQLGEAWRQSSGVDELIVAARKGAHDLRHTHLMCIGQAGPVVTMAAVSTRSDGRWPVLGFAAHNDPSEAAKAAVSEMFQMELSLTLARHAYQSGSRTFETSTLQRAHLLETSKAALLNTKLGNIPQYAPLIPGDVATALGVSIRLVDLTRQDIAVPVYRAMAEGLKSARSLKFAGTCGPV